MGDKTSHPESPEAVSDRVHGGAESDRASKAGAEKYMPLTRVMN